MQHHIYALPYRSAPDMGSVLSQYVPLPLTPLLGREHELAQLKALLHRTEVRLLTLTGLGGVGKTRLLIEVAHDLAPDLEYSICFVSLAAISDSSFVVPTIAQAFGLREVGSHSLLDELQIAIGNQSFLLLLDNFEQVLSAAPQLADLLAACPHLKLLVTSRAALRIRGEYEFPVSPLPLPNLTNSMTSEALSQYAALTLFLQRAQAIKPSFQMTEANVRTIAEVCIRLDGLPLAIELAAARTRLLSPQALLARLEHRLNVLTEGAHDLPDRQQTLRATIAWSYQLLTPQEQQFFRLLSVFVGGCMLEAVEAIASTIGLTANNVLDGVSVLLENHLMQQEEQADGEPRLLLLETIREYGLENLERSGELEVACTAHAEYYLALAEKAAPQLRGAEQVQYIALLERERQNMRAALSFLLEQTHTQKTQSEGNIHCERILRFCVALFWFWHIRGYGREGLSYLMPALAECSDVETALRAKALLVAAELSFLFAKNTQFEQLAEESLTLYQQLGDAHGIAYSLFRLGGIARIRSQFALAQTRLEVAAADLQKLGDHWKQGQCYTERARVATEQGHYEQARTFLSESRVLYQNLGDVQRLSWVCYLEARLLFVSQQDQALARQLAEQSLTSFREQGNTFYSSIPLCLLGLIYLEDGNLMTARSLLEEGIALNKKLGGETETLEPSRGLARLLVLQGDVDSARLLYQESLTLLLEWNVCKEHVAASLEGLAVVEVSQGTLRQGVRLWGAAHALREAIGAPVYPVYRVRQEQAIAHTRTQLGVQVFRAAWDEGSRLTPEQVLAPQSTTSVQVQSMPKQSSAPFPAGLTPREVEVLRLLVTGMTDAQVAESLVISPRTVNGHLTSIYSKLQVSSRTAAVRYALDHHLI